MQKGIEITITIKERKNQILNVCTFLQRQSDLVIISQKTYPVQPNNGKFTIYFSKEEIRVSNSATTTGVLVIGLHNNEQGEPLEVGVELNFEGAFLVKSYLSFSRRAIKL